MLFDDDEDSEERIPSVHPNDILDIDLSPAITTRKGNTIDGIKSTPRTHRIVTKTKKTKKNKRDVATENQGSNAMKRGDPFLPSVMADENPIAEYSTKKTIHKMPSDCNCKGMGYNCSPSAILPEEMRQQWGCGMFGKATPVKSGTCGASDTSGMMARPIPVCGSMMENVSTPRTTFYGNTCSFSMSPKTTPSMGRAQSLCWECKAYPCLCFFNSPRSELFSTLDSDERKHKILSKGNSHKGKANKTRLLINASSSQPVKRITCLNKENNIISTSNYSKENDSALTSASEESNYYFESKYNSALKSSVRSRSDNYRNKVYLTNHDFASSPRLMGDETGYIPRYRHRIRSGRRSGSSIPTSAITTANGPYGDARMYEQPLQRIPFTSKQMFMNDPQVCYCERCERRVQLLSKMEALGFPSSNTHPKPMPYFHQPPQRYNQPTNSYIPLSSNRFMPYSTYPYPYSNTIQPDIGTFTPPQVIPPLAEDSMINNGRDNMFPSFMSSSNVSDPFAYLDTDNMLDSPDSSSGMVSDDLLDLSVKETVDYFMGLKSPFADTLPLSLDNIETDTENETFGCGIDDNVFSVGSGGMSNENNEGRHFLSPLTPHDPRFNNSGFGDGDMQSESMSDIYSSIISDLEDELKCAIENIPIE